MILMRDTQSSPRRKRGKPSLFSGVLALYCLLATHVQCNNLEELKDHLVGLNGDGKGLLGDSGLQSFEAASALTGVGYRNQTDFSGDVRSSMFGGAEIYIKGEGMAIDALYNYLIYTVTSFNDVRNYRFITDDDIFMSAPKHGILATHTPSLMTVLDADWKDFDGRSDLSITGYDAIYVTTQIIRLDNFITLGCESSASCRIRYKRDWTPVLHDVVPNVVYAGQRVDFWFDVRDVHSTDITPADYFPIEDLRIGNKNCDWNGLMDYQTRLKKYQLGKLPAYVGYPKPNENSPIDARFMSGYAYKQTTSYHCNYAGDDCWYVRVLPKIETISASSGYSTGHQMLTITGQGLDGTDVIVTTDDADCAIQTKTSTILTCLTSENLEFTDDSDDRPGQQGLVKTVYDPEATDVTPLFGSIEDENYPIIEQSLATSFEVTDRYDVMLDETANTSILNEEFENSVAISTTNYLNVLDGWFKAPVDGKYRFFVSCSGQCRLEFDETNYYGSGNDIDATTIVDADDQPMSFRNYLKKIGSGFTTDFNKSVNLKLTEGRYYHIRGLHRHFEGNAHFSVAVQIQNGVADLPDHPNARREIQTFEIDQDQTSEDWFIEVDNPNDTAKWFLVFTANNGTEVTPEEENYLSFTDEDWKIRNKLKDYFFNPFVGSNIECKSTLYKESFTVKDDVKCYNANVQIDCAEYEPGKTTCKWSNGITTDCKAESVEEETDDLAEATKIVYRFRLWKRINGFSFADVRKVSDDDTPIFTFLLPAKSDEGAVASSAPFGGSFTIKCQDPDSEAEVETRNIPWQSSGQQVSQFMNEDIPFLASSVRGYDIAMEQTRQRAYWDNYRKFIIEFVDYLGDVAQCTIQSATDSGQELTGNNPTFSSETLSKGGKNLFFDPIPFEMLYTHVTQPQVKVIVDGLESACANVDCDYQFEDSYATVTEQEFDQEDNLKISVQGTNLSTLSGLKIMFGGAPCGEIKANVVDIFTLNCNLEYAPYGGDHDVELYDAKGLVQSSELIAINIPVTVTQVYPGSLINKNGGDELTITGTGFPNDASLIEVQFSDSTYCLVTSSTSTQIVCQIEGFDESYEDSLDSDSSMRFSIQWVDAPIKLRRRRLQGALFPPTEGASFSIKTDSPSVVSVTPSTLSPVLKDTLTFTLQGYDDLVAQDFTVSMISLSDKSIKPLNVMGVDEFTKTLTVRFPGAASGTYAFKVRGLGGSLSCPPSTINIETVMMLTDFTPKYGSTKGGTLLTLTGYHFGNEITDNPVKVGDNDCFVETTSDTEITCRIAELTDQDAEFQQIIVFAKTTEEQQCNIDGDTDCTTAALFEFRESKYTVDDVVSQFKEDLNAYQVAVQGTLKQNLDKVELYIDGVKQEVIQATKKRSKFKVTHMRDSTSSDVKYYSNDGIPIGAADQLQSITLEPALLRILPSTGSSGGAKLWVTGAAFGIDTLGLNLYHQESDQNICSSVEVLQYGSFTCNTIIQEIQSTDTIKLVVGSEKYSCKNADTTLCTYAALDASSPTVSAISLTDASTLTITGSNFDTGVNSIDCNMQGVVATGAVDSETQVTCTFSNGVPLTTSETSLSLMFKFAGDAYQNTALSGDQKVSNPVGPMTGQTGLNCSFQGGCMYSVTGSGLANTLIGHDEDKITVCNRECVLDFDESSASITKCRLPSLMTTFSASTFNMAEASNLAGEWNGSGSDSELSKLMDGNNLGDYLDSTSPCYYQISATSGYVYQIQEVKVFINNLLDKAPYDTYLKLQGSDETQSSWTDLYTFDDDIHEGWNSIFPEEESSYSFNTLRFYGEKSGSCRIGEIKLIGLEVFSDINTSTSCTAKITIDGVETELSAVEYNQNVTPYLDVITPRFGAEQGGETVVFTGSGFSFTPTVLIDDRECVLQSFDSTTITCTTSDKPFSSIKPEHPSLVISIDGVGNVATKGLLYRYVARWSSTQTWGGDFPPEEGDAVDIPKGRTLLVDVDSTPVLSSIFISGALIFAPEVNKTHQRTFDADMIIVYGGYLEIGTEEFPYDSKLTITMHGNETSPALPAFGNKVIAVWNGRLEMHGPERSHVWTELYETVNPGDTSITLVKIAVGAAELDWQVGEEIVIASTDFEGRHAEQLTITKVTNRDTRPIVEFSQALSYKHYAGEEKYGDETLEMRAEVGLLSRNVKYRGDPETSAMNQYGAHIMMASPGDESVVGKIENCEFTDVGQAFKLGRYPIHFHMIGTVTQSYIKNNSIHQTYNRAITIHGVHYLRIINNVAYKIMGHAIFIEDAAETKNLIDGNLVVDTRASDSLLNTDQTPASFWITHPDNIVRNNHAAGSDRYGFWYDLQVHPSGPSFDPNICPENTKLGEFRDNVAHSNGRYGLRIFHQMIPRQKPCSAFSINRNSESYPFGSNAPIIAEFHNLVAYKNKRNGAITERTGAVQFHNFKVADNILAGIEFSDTSFVPFDGYTMVIGGLVVGRSANRETKINDASPHGIIGPRSEWLRIDGTKFYNFDFNSAAGLGDCSHCFHPASTDMGARTISTQNLFFDSTASKRIRFQYPFRGIFWDMDGTLTDLGANSWATDNWIHLQQDECQIDEDVYDGIICDNTVEVRQILFNNYSPNHFDNQEEFVVSLPQKLQDQLTEDSTEEDDLLKKYLEDDANFSKIFQTKELEWAAPFVTGKRYNIRWGTGLDFEEISMTLSERWTQQDKQVLFMSNHIDPREKIEFYDVNTDKLIANMTYSTDLTSGANYVYNWTDTREFGWRASMGGDKVSKVRIEGIRCVDPDCDLQDIEPIPITDYGYWSEPGSWPDGVVPTSGSVNIIPGLWIIYDLEDSPVFDVITVNGRLTFLDDADKLPNLNLNCKYIFVRAGQLQIGTADAPFQANAKITLFGEKDDEQIKMSGTVEAGNKLIANSGLVELYGKPRDRMVRLLSPVFNDYKETLVEQFLDWQAGDMLYFAPTNHNPTHHEYLKIKEYNPKTGLLKLSKAFKYYHYGGSDVSDDWGGIDARCEVILLSRNVQIVGDDSNDWGCALMTTDRIEFDKSIRIGRMILSNIEIQQGGQDDTYKAAIRYEGASRSEISVIDGVVAWGGNAKLLYIKTSKNILVKNSAFLGGQQVGIILEGITNVHLDNIFLGDVKSRIINKNSQNIDKEGGIAFCSFNTAGICRDSSIQNSIVAGVIYGGYIVPGNQCGDSDSNTFKNNVAHSIQGTGAYIYPDPADRSQSSCYEGSFFKAYKCTDTPLTTFYKTKEVRIHDMVFLDNSKGVSLMIGTEGEDLQITMIDVKIFGEDDNLDCPDRQRPYAKDKYGLMLFSANQNPKKLHPTMPSSLPIYKIKSNGSWGAQVSLAGVEFHKFKATTKCGMNQHAMKRNPYSSDYIPIHKFKGTKFYDVQDQAVIMIEDPNKSWAVVDDCGTQMPCTAPNNVVLQFEGTQFIGIDTPANKDSSFTIVSDVKSATESYYSCVTVDSWNAAYCQNNKIGVLLFESLDDDTSDRTIVPIIISNEETGYSNTINSMMDHVWDGFYTGQLRLSRFPVQIETGQDYLIYMTGTPPNKMRYTLKAKTDGIKLRLYYPNAGAYQVYANDNLKAETDWDASLGSPGALTKTKGCGENRFVGVENFLEFYITAGCEIKVEPYNQIKTSVRLSWNLDEFYAEGGTTTFTDRVSAALGIPSYRVKVVSVYEGSVIIDFIVIPDESAEDPTNELESINDSLIQLITTKTDNWLGAPILNVVSGDKVVIQNEDQDVIETPTKSKATLIDDWLAQRDEKKTSTIDDSETEKISEPTADTGGNSSTGENEDDENDINLTDENDDTAASSQDDSIDDKTDIDVQQNSDETDQSQETTPGKQVVDEDGNVDSKDDIDPTDESSETAPGNKVVDEDGNIDSKDDIDSTDESSETTPGKQVVNADGNIDSKDVIDSTDESSDSTQSDDTDDKDFIVQTDIENRYVTQTVLLENTDKQEDFLQIIQVVIICVIVIVGILLITRLCLNKRQTRQSKKVLAPLPSTNDISSDSARPMNKETQILSKSESQPELENHMQFMAHEMDDILNMSSSFKNPNRSSVLNPTDGQTESQKSVNLKWNTESKKKGDDWSTQFNSAKNILQTIQEEVDQEAKQVVLAPNHPRIYPGSIGEIMKSIECTKQVYDSATNLVQNMNSVFDESEDGSTLRMMNSMEKQQDRVIETITGEIRNSIFDDKKDGNIAELVNSNETQQDCGNEINPATILNSVETIDDKEDQ